MFNAPTPTSPPLLVWDIHSESDGDAADGDEAPEAVVLAADGAGTASGAATDTDDANRGAVEADDRAEVLNNDADKTQGRRTRGGASRGGLLAALDRAGATFVASNDGGGGGGRKEREGEGGDG